ncbi:hypothetical protein TNCV_834801 [Trichonephila clavipes]|nr:hypothetical protein TNCV_834801 [Trichonephila clavipes]
MVITTLSPHLNPKEHIWDNLGRAVAAVVLSPCHRGQYSDNNQKTVITLPFSIVVSDTDCCAVGPGFESRRSCSVFPTLVLSSAHCVEMAVELILNQEFYFSVFTYYTVVQLHQIKRRRQMLQESQQCENSFR